MFVHDWQEKHGWDKKGQGEEAPHGPMVGWVEAGSLWANLTGSPSLVPSESTSPITSIAPSQSASESPDASLSPSPSRPALWDAFTCPDFTSSSGAVWLVAPLVKRSGLIFVCLVILYINICETIEAFIWAGQELPRWQMHAFLRGFKCGYVHYPPALQLGAHMACC